MAKLSSLNNYFLKWISRTYFNGPKNILSGLRLLPDLYPHNKLADRTEAVVVVEQDDAKLREAFAILTTKENDNTAALLCFFFHS